MERFLIILYYDTNKINFVQITLILKPMLQMTYFLKISIVLLTILFGLTVSSCKKNKGFSAGNLDFSTDTLVFDTVFTTIGSTTKRLKLYNNTKGTINIQEAQLIGGSSSPFRINLDGVKGTNFANIEIEKGDSLFVFVEVTLQVNNGTLPMVVEDQLRFRTNGKDQTVQLAVWGQDAYFHYNDINSGTWPNDKPHVVYGYAGIDSATTLNVQAGTQIFMHKNALIYNFKGTLNMEGTKDNKIVVQGDRLEQYYLDQSGQYYGIYMEKARPSTIKHVEIKNGTAGIHMFGEDPSNTDYTLKLSYSEIWNNSRYGVFIYSGARVKAENCLIYKNESHALIVLEGGDFNFNYCHLLGYAAAANVPAIGISNYFKPSNSSTTNYGNINEGTLTNCVITGNQLTELVIDTQNPNNAFTLNFNIKSCMITSETVPTESYFGNIFWNQNPGFISVEENDFTFSVNSPLNNNASTFYLITPTFNDFFEIVRDNTNPDIGAIELP